MIDIQALPQIKLSGLLGKNCWPNPEDQGIMIDKGPSQKTGQSASNGADELLGDCFILPSETLQKQISPHSSDHEASQIKTIRCYLWV